MKYVKITHPQTGRTATVPEISLPHHVRGGWTLVGEPGVELEQSDEQSEDEQPRRSRKNQ